MQHLICVIIPEAGEAGREETHSCNYSRRVVDVAAMLLIIILFKAAAHGFTFGVRVNLGL